MIGELSMILVAAAATPSAEFEAALPVESTGKSDNPFLIQAWPGKGCTNCAVSDDDKPAISDLVKDLKAPVGTASHYPKIEFHLLKVRPLADSLTSIDYVREQIEACRPGIAGMLSPNPTSNVTAFGLRFDCEATMSNMWMSVVMDKDHRPTRAYLVPKYPLPLLKKK